MLSSRTRRGGGVAATDGHEAALNFVLASDGELDHDTVAHESAANLSTMKVALVKPGGHGNDLPPKPQTRRQVRSRQSGNAEKRRKKRRWVASSAKESGRNA